MSKPMFENDGMNQTFASEAQTIAELATRRARPRVIELTSPTGEKAPVLALPKDLRLESAKPFFDQYREAPERRRGTAKLFDLDSLIAHARRFRDEGTALFADPKAPSLTVVFDYHHQNTFEDPADIAPATVGAPRFGEHRALYEFPLSDEWKAWTEASGTPLSQADFAAFLETRIFDVTDPLRPLTNAQAFMAASGITSFASPSALQQLALGLTVHVDERATTKINPSTGECTMLYETEHHGDPGSAAVPVPRAFLIAIPVFRSGTPYQLPVRLRYRLAAGRISWFIDVHDAPKAFDDALRDACELAADRTGIPLYFGSPER